MLKSKNISNICTAEFIDRLVIITDYTEVFIFRGQQAYKLKLCSIGILILIHHNVFKPLLIVLQHIFLRLEKLHTVRIQGRRDWQLLYVAKGAGHFFRPREERVKQGSVVVYPPGEPQDYFYLLKEAPEIYWIHFTGERAEGLLEEWGLFHGHSCFVGEQDRYLRCFEEIIQELQLQPPGFQRLCALRFEELLLSMGRQRLRLKNPQLAGDSLVTQVLNDMYKTYYRNYTIEDYAKRHNVSVCWLIRRFKQVTGESPNQYLIQIRIRRARELLESSRLNMGEIASVLGYESPLYFSRQFKQLQGVSPKRYREQRQK